MKPVFTLLILSFFGIGCSSSNNSTPTTTDIDASDPTPTVDGNDETVDELDDPTIVEITNKINVENYAELVASAEKIGFRTFTREYDLSTLTKPFTEYTNELLEDNSPINASMLDDTRSCEVAGNLATTGVLIAGAADFNFEYTFSDCETNAGAADGTASYSESLVIIEHEYDLALKNVDIQGVRGDRVIKGKFTIEDNQQLSKNVDFVVSSFEISIPDSSFMSVTGNGKYFEKAFVDLQGPTGASADSTLQAELILTMATGESPELYTFDVNFDLGLASTADLGVAPPVSGSLTISADDDSSVIVTPADVAGMVNIDLIAPDGVVTRDVRNWSDLLSTN